MLAAIIYPAALTFTALLDAFLNYFKGGTGLVCMALLSAILSLIVAGLVAFYSKFAGE